MTFFFLFVVEYKTQVSPYGIKNDLKHHKSDSCIDPKRFCEVEQQVRPSTGAELAKNGPKSEFQSFPDPNPGLTGSNPVSTPNPDPNPVLIRFLLLIQILTLFRIPIRFLTNFFRILLSIWIRFQSETLQTSGFLNTQGGLINLC